jgi:hypothetical protein
MRRAAAKEGYTMRSLGRLGVGVAAAALGLVCWGGVGWGQQGQGPTPPSGRAGQTSPQAPQLPPIMDNPNGEGAASISEQQARMRNNDRQKQLVDETQKLLSLANELKSEVDKSTKDTLSLEVIRKADEIEKLAHDVKEKMKGS